MAAKLVLTYGGRREERALEGNRTTVGRDPKNTISITDEKMSVSRFHARFDFDGHKWRVVDTMSRNRVKVNNELIEQGEAGARVLNDGDTVVLGGFPLQFVREDDGLIMDEPPARTLEWKPSQTLATRLKDLPALIGTGAGLSKEAQEVIDRAKRTLTVVTALGQRIAAVTPIDEIIEAIVDLVFETTPAERAGLFLWDDEAGRLVPKRARAKDPSKTAAIHVSESLVKKAFDARMPVQLDPQGEPSASMNKLGLRSAVAVPLLDEKKAVGVIYADTSIRSGAFDAFGVALLSALANHAAIALEQSRLLRRVKREEIQRAKLERFLARGVVDRILASGESSPGIMLAEEADVTVLFCDMVGFTGRSEKLAPHEVLMLLNQYFGHMTEVILEREGTLDKYIGDCIMAVFGAPQPQKDHARRAAIAALGMREAIQKVNQNARPEAKVQFRIGMHSGRVIAGDVGHATRRDWTVLGSTVNLASRMESSVAQTNQIVLTGETRAQLGDDFELRPVQVTKPLKGILRDVEAFELLAARAARTKPL